MKRLLIFVIISLSISCSNDNSSSAPNSLNALHPPIWTHGTWTYEAGGISMGLKFSSDNVCTVTSSVANCYKEALALYEGTQATTNVNEQISDNEYKVDITISGSTVSYDVVKISDTKINWKINSTTSTILIKQ